MKKYTRALMVDVGAVLALGTFTTRQGATPCSTYST